MKKYSIYELSIVKVNKENGNIYYFICKYDNFNNTCIEIFTNKHFKIYDKSLVEPLANYYSILEQCNYATGKALMLSKDELLLKFIDIDKSYNYDYEKSIKMN